MQVIWCLRYTKLCWVGKDINITMKPRSSPSQGQLNPRKIRVKVAIFRLFRYAYPSSSFRCIVASARLCCLSRVPPAVCPSLLESATTDCVYFLSAISSHLRTYADASFHITIQARSTNTRFTYVQSFTLLPKANSFSWFRNGFYIGNRLQET